METVFTAYKYESFISFEVLFTNCALMIKHLFCYFSLKLSSWKRVDQTEWTRDWSFLIWKSSKLKKSLHRNKKHVLKGREQPVNVWKEVRKPWNNWLSIRLSSRRSSSTFTENIRRTSDSRWAPIIVQRACQMHVWTRDYLGEGLLLNDILRFLGLVDGIC